MELTSYFENKLKEPDYQHLKREWIEQTFSAPEFEIKEIDGRYARYRKIPEADNQYLKVIVLKNRRTIKDAFIDLYFNPRKARRRAQKSTHNARRPFY
ncbi:hypothetical protein ACFO4O_08835 [Glaciecola siphonariae]|uniref:Uncharacterized protein n=1 Tax=Glaciecola siphonariae TaxID=521012 RepID=A0ABV9LWB0_9ALTE